MRFRRRCLRRLRISSAGSRGCPSGAISARYPTTRESLQSGCSQGDNAVMNMMNTEVELKLRVDPDSLTALAAKPVLVAASASSEHLHAIYFDTADHRLHAQSLSLRVRREGEKFIQTLKVGDAGPSGLHRRTEWEAPVPGNKPDLSLLPGKVLREHLDGIAASELVPAFETVVERTIRQIEYGNTLDGATAIEVAIDRGEIRAGDAVLPIAEIELEFFDDPTDYWRVMIPGAIPPASSRSELKYPSMREVKPPVLPETEPKR